MPKRNTSESADLSLAPVSEKSKKRSSSKESRESAAAHKHALAQHANKAVADVASPNPASEEVVKPAVSSKASTRKTTTHKPASRSKKTAVETTSIVVAESAVVSLPAVETTTAPEPLKVMSAAAGVLNEVTVEPVAKTFAEPTREEIAFRAYLLWERRGYQHGSPDADWLEAERQLRAERLA
jgi:hypothetical protein